MVHRVPAARRRRTAPIAPSVGARALAVAGLIGAPAAFAGPQDGAPQETPPDAASVDAPQVDVGPPPTVADTSAMDPGLAGFLAERVAAVEAAPADVEARRDLGLAYEANTIWTLAVDSYDQAIELAPEAAEWRFRRGVVRFYTGDLMGALEDLRAAAEAYKNTPVVQARLGDVLRVAGELEEAEGAWRRAIAAEAKQPQNIEYAASRVGLAQVLLDLDRAEEALALTEEALGLEPANRHAQFIRGRALRDLGRMDEAEVALSIGEDSFPGFPPDPHQVRLNDAMRGFNRRMMLIENLVVSQQFGEARARLTEMLGERPEDHMVLNLAARVELKAGDTQRARELLDRSLEVAPDEPSTLVEACLLELEGANATMNRLAMMQQQGAAQQPAMQQMQAQGKAQAERAVEYGQRACELAPFVGRNRFWYGMAQRALAGFQNDQQQAMQVAQKALQTLQAAGQLGCDEPAFHQQISTLFAQTGNTGQALKHAELHLAANPVDAGALQQVIHLNLQNSRQAAIAPYVARLDPIAVELKNPALMQYVIQGYLTNQEFEAAERMLPEFEEVTAGNAQAASFVVNVRQFIATERQKAQTPPDPPQGETPDGGDAGGENGGDGL